MLIGGRCHWGRLTFAGDANPPVSSSVTVTIAGSCRVPRSARWWWSPSTGFTSSASPRAT
jgi:hypothetical protein